MAEQNEMEEMRANMVAMQKSIEDMGNVIKTLVMLIPKNPSPRRTPLNNERTNPLHEEDWYEEELQPVRQNIEVPAAAPRSPLNVEQPATDKYKTLQDQIEELKRTVIRSKESDESESFEVEEDLWPSKTEVNHLTRSGRHYKPTHLVGEESSEAAVTKDAREEDLGDDDVLKQLKRTGANITLWQLIMASHKHRQTVLKALNKVPIPIDNSPEKMVAMLTPVKATNAITFTDKDLPPAEGEDVLFCGFDEPLYDEETGERYPGSKSSLDINCLIVRMNQMRG
ncbi:hypothetical protein Vadar_011211 [Vaccinium darrowii]|uniref:Uncharacterized protein n=1 Tax=Vaccinium darrowii TaxID=229202 RepID=A0ACB7XZU4_9ERIC|nr:hypothetical protein Vadar_011211 [Vaccinium darrowii]